MNCLYYVVIIDRCYGGGLYCCLCSLLCMLLIPTAIAAIIIGILVRSKSTTVSTTVSTSTSTVTSCKFLELLITRNYKFSFLISNINNRFACYSRIEIINNSAVF